MHRGDPVLRVERAEDSGEKLLRFLESALEIRCGAEARVHDDAIAPDVAFDARKELAADAQDFVRDVIGLGHRLHLKSTRT